MRCVSNCKYCGKAYKYTAWLSRHEFKHWWNEVATPKQKKFFRDKYKHQEDAILFGFKAKSKTCGEIGNWHY